MRQFFTLSITGLATAAIFAVAASGLVLTYTTTGVFNFAHGAIGMLGAFAYWQFRYGWNWPAPLALAMVLLVLAPAFGAAIEIGIMRRLQDVAEATRVVVTISLLVGCLGLGLWIWGPDTARPLPLFFQGKKVSVGGVPITWHEATAFVVALLVAAGLRALLYRTRAGVTMRAAVDDRPLVMLNGGTPDRSAMLAWAIGCSLAALAGILIAPQLTLSHVLLTLLIVNAYAAALIGRLRSMPLTFLGAIILGLADAYGTGYIPTSNRYFTGFRPAIPVIILFVVLLLLPQTRLRGHRARRIRESYPRPTWAGTAVGCGLLVAGTALLATTLTQSDALRVSKVFALGIIALSLVPLVGYGGQISLCPMSFAGIGAVAMAHQGHGGNPMGLVFAAVITGTVGAVIALPALRLSGIYLALSTAAFAVALDRWIFNLPAFDLGPWNVKFFGLGSVGVDRLRVPGFARDSQRAQLVLLSIAFALLTLVVVWVRRGRLGERLLAMKDSPAACATLGLNLTMTKLAVFTLSAAMAGVGGALFGSTLGSVSPESFNLFQSLPLVLLAVVGGIGSVGGALFAGIVLGGIPIVTATWAWFNKPSQVLPGFLGVTVGNTPNGVVPDLAKRFEPLRRAPAVMVGLAVALAALFAARANGALANWPFAIATVVAIFAAPAVAELLATRRARAATDEPAGVALEWVGVVRPFTPDDVRRLDDELALPSVRG